MLAGRPAAQTDRHPTWSSTVWTSLFAISRPCWKRALEQKKQNELEVCALWSLLIIPAQVLNWNNLIRHICSSSLFIASFCSVPFVHFGFSKLLTELHTNIFTLIGCFCGSQINQPPGI